MSARVPARSSIAQTVKRGLFRKVSRLAAGALLTASVTGCTSLHEYVQNCFKVGPNYGRPEAPVAKDWIDANDIRVRRDTTDLSRWWKVLNDPMLDSLTDYAYQQNLSLREAGFRIMAARANLGITIGSLFPQSQSASGGYSRLAQSVATANREALQTRFYQQWDLGFNVAWELDFWGRFRRSIETANAILDASVENYDDVLVTLLGDVASSYVRIRTLQKQIELTQANVELQKTTLTLAQARFKAGQTSELDVDQSTSNLAQTQALIPQLEIQLRQESNKLCILLGIPPEDLKAKLGQAPIPTAPAEVAVGVPADLISRRPDVRRAERQAAAQCARIGVAVSELYPHISIAGTFGTQAEHFADLFTDKAFRGSIGPGFRWNILNYGRLVNNIHLQDARFQALVVTYQNTVLQAGKEVEDGIVTFLQSKQQEKYLAESVKAAEKAVKIAVAQYRAGTVDFNRVAFLQQNLVQQQDQLAQAQGTIAQGLIQTYRALGGGWEIRLDHIAEQGHPPAHKHRHHHGMSAPAEPRQVHTLQQATPQELSPLPNLGRPLPASLPPPQQLQTLQQTVPAPRPNGAT